MQKIVNVLLLLEGKLKGRDAAVKKNSKGQIVKSSFCAKKFELYPLQVVCKYCGILG